MSASSMVAGLTQNVTDTVHAFEFLRNTYGDSVRNVQSLGFQMFSFNVNRDAAKAAISTAAAPGVEFVEFDTTYSTTTMSTNDPLVDRLWGLERIDAATAWSKTTGRGVTVAVIDTGVDLAHPDLIDNLWYSAGEIAGNGLDDDGNGFVDDVFGYDFINGDPVPQDDNRHGTHVAGTIGAKASNNIGIAGAAFDVSIMGVKVLGKNGRGASSAVAAGIIYATDNGADVINLSLGGGQNSTIGRAVDYAISRGVVVIAAAGNNHQPNSSYPASHPDVISVASSDQSDGLSYFSNYGTDIDIAAPGSNILSTVPGGYATFSGTSMATPHVSATAALILQQTPGMSIAAIRERMTSSADTVNALANVVPGGRRLNAAAALDPTYRRPNARDDSAVAIRTGSVSIDVTANDSDPLGQPLQLISAQSIVAGGSATVSGGNVLYSAPNGFTGIDVVQYRVANLQGLESTGILRINVLPMSMEGQRLMIEGTSGADTIHVMQNGASYVASMNGFSFSLSDEIRAIHVDAGDGDDYVRMDVAVPTVLYGRRGNDTLIGGSARDRIFGGHQDDQIFGRQGGDVIYAGSGIDTIYTGGGLDEVYIANQNSDTTVDGRKIRWYKRRGYRDWLLT